MKVGCNKMILEKGLFRRQTHLLRLLHPDGMADEYFYNIIIGHRLSSINKKDGTGGSRPHV